MKPLVAICPLTAAELYVWAVLLAGDPLSESEQALATNTLDRAYEITPNDNATNDDN